MAAVEDSRTRRVKEITEFIRSRNWSLNDFLVNFYSSTDSSITTQQGRCLTKSDEARFTPEELIDLWFEHCPQSSRPYLEHVIVDRASRVIVKETHKACQKETLQVPTTSLEADNLDEDFLLSGLEKEYFETLPLFCFLLNAIMLSKNRSEQRKGEVAASKEERAKFVEFSLSFNPISQLSHLTGLRGDCEHRSFHKEPGHECLSSNHGAVSRDIWGEQTCFERLQPYGSMHQLRVGLPV